MLDLAELTLTVSSDGVDEGTRSLQALEKAARGAEAASQKFATLAEKAWRASGQAIQDAAEAARSAVSSFRSMDEAALRVHNLRSKFDDVYRSASKLEMELEDLAEAERLGVQITGGYSQALDRLVLKHDKAAAAAAKQVQIYKQLAAAERLAATSSDSQARYNSAAGISLGIGKSARDSAAVFKEQFRETERLASAAERLRGRIDPLYAAQSRLNDELQHYNTLARGGYITTQELAKAQAMAQTQYQITAKSIAEQGVAYANNRAQMANTVNLTHQLQDVAVTAAMGMNPLTIALQQGTQAAMAFHGAKPAEAVGMLAGALKSLASPTALITMGIIALAAVTIQWAMSSTNSAKEAKKALDDYRSSVDALTKSYEKNAEQSRIQAEAAERLARARLQSTVINQVQSGLNQTGVQDVLSGWRYWSRLLSGAGTLDSIESVFQPFNRELKVLQQGLAEGRPDLEAFESAVVATAESLKDSVPNIEIYRDRLLETFGIASEGARALDPAVLATNRLTAAQEALSNAVDSFDPHGVGGKLGDIQDRVEGLVRQFNAGQISVGELSNRLDTIPDASGALKPTIDSVKTLAAEAWKAYVAASMLAEALPLAPKGDRLPTTQQRLDAASEDYRIQYALWRRMNPDAFDLEEDLEKRANKKVKKSDAEKEAERQQKAYDKLILSGNQFIEQKKFETEALFMTEEAAARLRKEQEYLNSAQRSNIDLSPEQEQALIRLAHAAADAETQFKKMQEALEFGKDLVKGFVSDLRSGLEQGKGFWRSFGDAAINVLDKIVDKLLNDVIDAIFRVNQAGRSGGGGGLLGFLGGLFGGGGGFTNFEHAWTAAVPGLWAKGGAFPNGISGFSNTVVDRATPFFFAKGAGIMGEAGPEAIMPLKRGPDGSLGVRAQLANQNVPQSLHISVTVNGARGNAEIEEMVHQGVAKGLQRFPESQSFRAGVQSSFEKLRSTRGIR